ncbi:MAG: hypothetical protein COA83_10330 [Methylophaga sp.]|nr:MAG: hypothetical protein COA83_10330 [Methylophaga sp.]
MAYYADMKYLGLILLLCISSLNADVYRLQDENGRIIYSDQFHPDAELINITKPTSYKPPVINNPPDVPQQEQVQAYEIAILSPEQDEAFWANDGNVPVTVDVQPALNVEKGEMLIIMLDGMQIGEPQPSTDLTVSITERGAHTISVSLINEVGVTLATSPSVNFQVHRASQ